MVRVRRERCVNAVASMQRACRRGLDEVGRQHQRGHRAAADRRADIEAAADRLGGSTAERPAEAGARSGERSVGKACVSTCSTRWSQLPLIKKTKQLRTRPSSKNKI